MMLAPELSLPALDGAPPAAPAFPSRPRFTIDGSDALERHLDHVRDEVRATVLHAFPTGEVEAILLGGGYGRGEGGVLRTPTGDRPYNDLEFYVALSGPRLLNERRHAAKLQELAHDLSRVAGLEVEFKIIALPELRRGPVTMFSYDLVLGHRWVYGDDRLLAGCARHRQAELIPPAEATRLLMNRCSGLLFACERLERVGFTDDDADFVGRNLAKARLALGDAVLATLGRYHWSCRERHQRLSALVREAPHLPAWLGAVHRHHRAGVEFKLHPQCRTTAAMLRREHEELSLVARAVWLWLESRRLNRPFDSARDYALARIDRCPDASPLRNFALNLLTFGAWAALAPNALRSPRERLLIALPLLLWEPALTVDPALLRVARAQLHTRASGRPALIRAYESVWTRFR